ncbi:hypothetical protein N7G274_009445 [Stereocaulon virgatum]|uniref:DUF4048 domain-containing protein n=1 Tax=Stereocaulon virgatum TaxID=373712 RepID=A0ABR3ZX29_9LECA
MPLFSSTMANLKRQSMPPPNIAPLRLDSATMMRGSLEMSPGRSSVQSSNGQSRAHIPSSSVPSTPFLSARPPSPERRAPPPGESNSFLTALAAQERRVLELKEELQKAELELEKLKKQWAAQEAVKKRNEVRHLEQLQPLHTSLVGPHLTNDEEATRVNRGLDRRKRKSSSVRSSQRTVFSGSRHTRTLSLLSPSDSASSSRTSLQSIRPNRHPLETVDDVASSSTAHELISSTDGASTSTSLYKGPPREVLLETGKQLVGDLRHGLWTFFEDLKQVTVGDEAASTSDPRAQSSLPSGSLPKRQAIRQRPTSTKEGPARKVNSLSDVHSLTVTQNPSQPTRKTSISTSADPPTTTTTNSSDSDDDDGWDNWDTPNVKESTPQRKDALYIADPIVSPLTDKSSPRTSVSSLDPTPRSSKPTALGGKQDNIPWPALKKLSPSRLSRTASTLMDEWERSLKASANDITTPLSRETSRDRKED